MEPPTLRMGPRLGVGALAETFLAHDAEGAARVLKRMHRHCAYDPELVAMFEHEGRLLERLDHRAIPRMVARYRSDAGVPHMVLEYMPGRGLDTLMGEARVSEVQARWWMAALFDALDHVHGRDDEGGEALGVVHRDVAPSNVVVRDDGMVALLDFGIATSRWRADADRGVMKGTRGYMAPEVVTGEGTIDGRSDVFAAGVVLYELLSGRRLYAGPIAAVMVAVAEGPVPSLRDAGVTVSARVDELVRRCLAKRAEERPTAREARAILLGG